MLIFDSQTKAVELSANKSTKENAREETITMSYMFCGGKSLKKGGTAEAANENKLQAKRQGS